MKAIEDIIVKYDGTVRNAGGKVLEFLYGEDGMDAVAELESSKIDHIGIKQGELLSKCEHSWRTLMESVFHADDSPMTKPSCRRCASSRGCSSIRCARSGCSCMQSRRSRRLRAT